MNKKAIIISIAVVLFIITLGCQKKLPTSAEKAVQTNKTNPSKQPSKAENRPGFITGNYKWFKEINGLKANYQDLYMIGEDNDNIILAHSSEEKGESSSLFIVDTNTMSVLKRIQIKGSIYPSAAKIIDKNIALCLDNRIEIYSTTLEKIKEIPLPKTILEKIARKPNYDKQGYPDILFGGYDVSNDLTKIIYADEQGLKLTDINGNSEQLLSKTEKRQEGEILYHLAHNNPKFVADSKKVVSMVEYYKGESGYFLLNLDNGFWEIKSIIQDGSSPNILYDTGLLEVNTNIWEKQKNATAYLDFKTGNVKEIVMDSPGETSEIRDYRYCYVGQKYAGFITYVATDKLDYRKNIYDINRLNLETLKVEPKVISVKFAEAYILGVLQDGRVVFWYELNPNEKGICITN